MIQLLDKHKQYDIIGDIAVKWGDIGLKGKVN
jgi:hypothetical protein